MKSSVISESINSKFRRKQSFYYLVGEKNYIAWICNDPSKVTTQGFLKFTTPISKNLTAAMQTSSKLVICISVEIWEKPYYHLQFFRRAHECIFSIISDINYLATYMWYLQDFNNHGMFFFQTIDRKILWNYLLYYTLQCLDQREEALKWYFHLQFPSLKSIFMGN